MLTWYAIICTYNSQLTRVKVLHLSMQPYLTTIYLFIEI